MAKSICRFQYTKRIEAEKNMDKDGKALCKSMNNNEKKTMENLTKTIDVILVSNKNGHPNQAICHTKYLRMI